MGAPTSEVRYTSATTRRGEGGRNTGLRIEVYGTTNIKTLYKKVAYKLSLT
jgi:hypothetical protein